MTPTWKAARIITVLALMLWPLALMEPQPAQAQTPTPPGTAWFTLDELDATVLRSTNVTTGDRPMDVPTFFNGGSQVVYNWPGQYYRTLIIDLGAVRNIYAFSIDPFTSVCDYGDRFYFDYETTVGVDDDNWSGMTWFASLGGRQEWNKYAPFRTAQRYLRIRIQEGTCANVGGFRLLTDELATPTPTASPTPAAATPFPVVQACIPASSVITPTATIAPRTPTPFGTRTPVATPTRTPTAGPTATNTPLDLNILTDFKTTFAPWTTNGAAPLITRSELPGPNSQPGSALMPFSGDPTQSTLGQLPNASPAPNGNLLVFERLDMPRTIRLVADVQHPELLGGMYTYLQVFYWPDGGLGTVPWVLAANIRVNVAWHTVTTLINVPASQYPPRAIALRAVTGMSSIENPLGFIPQAAPGGVQLDNLRLTAGRDANSPLAVGLPVCAGSGGAQPPARPATKVCNVTVVQKDIYAVCQAPQSILEIGTWISWMVCRVQRYFGFLLENRQQIEQMRERQAANEPLGTLIEVPDVIGVVSGAINDFLTLYASTNPPAIDWSGWSNFDMFRGLRFPSPDLVLQLPDDCDFGGLNLPAEAQPWACWAITNANRFQLTAILQFLLNISPALIIVFYIRAQWMSSNA